MPQWKLGGYRFVMYDHDHPPLHLHVFKTDGRGAGVLVDRFDVEHGDFMDGTVGNHRKRVLRALKHLRITK